jgi:hypothetical protein
VVGFDPVDTVNEFCRLFPHGDRRAANTFQGIAEIVASPSEYRDEFSHVPERRGTGAPPKVSMPAAWLESVTLMVGRLARSMKLDRALDTAEPQTARTIRPA